MWDNQLNEETLKIELLRQCKLEAEFHNFSIERDDDDHHYNDHGGVINEHGVNLLPGYSNH